MMRLKGRFQGLGRRASDQAGQETRKKAAPVASTILLAAVIVFCVFVIFEVQIYGYVSIGGRSLFRVVTGSMEPTIPTGALLVSRKTPAEEIRVGDIICYRSRSADTRGWVITHRVTAILRDEDGALLLETKGDANTVADAAYATEQNLVGRVVWYTKSGNVLAGAISFLTNGIGFLAVVLIPCLLIAGLLLSRSVNSIRQELAALEELESSRTAVHKNTDETARAAAYGMTPEEYAALRQEIYQELMAEREKILAMVRGELEAQRQQGVQHEIQSAAGRQGPDLEGTTEKVDDAPAD